MLGHPQFFTAILLEIPGNTRFNMGCFIWIKSFRTCHDRLGMTYWAAQAFARIATQTAPLSY